MSKKTLIIILSAISAVVIAGVVLAVIFVPKQSKRAGESVSFFDLIADEIDSVTDKITGNDDAEEGDEVDDFEDIGESDVSNSKTKTKTDSGAKNEKSKSKSKTSETTQWDFDFGEKETEPDHEHKYKTTWSSSKPTHWHECSICGDRKDEAEHIYSSDKDTTCNVCGYTRTLKTTELKYKTNSSGYDYTKKVESHSDTEANKIKSKVYAEKNTADIYNITGKKYYMKKGSSLDDIPSGLKAGDAVLFERGGVWRVEWKKGIVLPNGVTMGAYGKGDKPKIYGSQRNFADNDLWEKQGDNLYRTFLHGGNAGNMVFNDIACLGVKKWKKEDVKSNYDFYYASNEYLYFYYEGDIEKDFSSFEIAQRENLINMNSGCIVDNICVKYGGSHGITGIAGCDNTRITNCEIGFIGGSMQSGTTRFGNGIEYHIGATNATVKDNHIYQCYDAGFTFQSWSTGSDTHYYDINFSDNLVENCCYCIEYFTTSGTKGSGSYSDYKNISITNNVLRFAGYEWSQLQRPDPWMTSLIRGGQWAYVPDCQNFKITDNIFDISKACVVFWWWNDPANGYIHTEPHNGLTVKNNTYYQAKTSDKRIITYHNRSAIYGSDYSAFVSAIKKFDSAPKKTVWFDSISYK
ncbi:MAG: right-handed parallel beta-helix repeat-containing protein [Clostridia bacterium]|nr:right-handed parallel beta-helix repeat-containing protein [Clostridia bacterium]